MGSCFSKRKRSDAAVTHNASPRSSFSTSCKGDTFTASSPTRAHKPSDEIVVVLTKDTGAFLGANSQNSVSLKKCKSKNAPCAQQQVENVKLPTKEKVENVKLPTKEKAGAVQSNSGVEEDKTLPRPAGHDEKASLISHSHSHSHEASIDKVLQSMHTLEDKASLISHSHSHEASIDKVLQSKHTLEASTDASKPPGGGGAEGLEHAAEKCATPDGEFMGDIAKESNPQDKEVHPSFDDEFVVDPSLARLKRSRSCEEALRSSETKRPLRRRSFQETSTFSPRTTKLETIPEPQFGTTKYLEGLDLVDVLPYRASQIEAPSWSMCAGKSNLKPTVLDLPQQVSNGLSADFFALKNRYLSSCSAAMHSASVCDARFQGDDSKMSPCNACPDEDDAMRASFSLMHSRTSSLDDAEHMEMLSLFPSSRHPISAVEEGDEDECCSDDSETFEFTQAVSVYAQQPNEKKAQLRSGGAEQGGDGEYCRVNERNELCKSKGGKELRRFKELSIVATGDAVLYTGSSSEEFDLIPSKSYVRGNPKRVSETYPSVLTCNQSTYQNSHKGQDDDEIEKQQQSSLSVEDIIFLLERDELDEEVLLSFLNLAKSTTPTSHAATALSNHVSDVASEASFEFKVKSSGSTPHSTPSTPMLSAGSTPKRMTQLSPLALTSEEIAEIWGVFEQRQALSPFQM